MAYSALCECPIGTRIVDMDEFFDYLRDEVTERVFSIPESDQYRELRKQHIVVSAVLGIF